ncbi:hypothetical protein Psuf_092490 [Phytohabitans suffuscus]|uniref:GHMP kinase N-terminal domain-containing protein n=1 Tax=Phytohabitans suffuscus TaxID=624315 RepID=A0A6F8Z0U1_9ACTN|nr:hypothetical protein [Phytohabitans suffuscus]BCB91936.1 hypothetical protein Psuf_092490 [Phytohabitans suffuscus]
MIVSQTPLRISLFGGGTDLADYYRQRGGAVLSFAIDKYVHVAVKPAGTTSWWSTTGRRSAPGTCTTSATG